MISDNLRAFLTAYLEWAENCDDPNYVGKFTFCKYAGLCDNFEQFCFETNAPYGSYRNNDLYHELEKDFEDDTDYPFNDDWEDYDTEADYGESYLNDKRLDWIKSKLKE